MRRDYSCDRNDSTKTTTTTTTTVSNKSKINDQPRPKTSSDGGDSSNFDFNAIQNYINKLEFNVLMGNKTVPDEHIIRDEDATAKTFNNKDKDSSESSTFVRGGAVRTSVQNHSVTNRDNDTRRRPVLRTRSDTERVDVLRKQMLVKTANQNMTLDANPMLKQQQVTANMWGNFAIMCTKIQPQWEFWIESQTTDDVEAKKWKKNW